MVLSVVVAATLLAAGAAGWAWRTRPRNELLRAAAAVPALFCILFLAAHAIARAHSDVWSFIRLMPSVAVLRGYPLYSPEGQGPLLGWSYGPAVPLLQLPVAALPTPAAALTGAALLNTAMLLLPLLFAIWRTLPADPIRRASGVVILAALHAVLLHLAPSQYWFRKVQVDTFAMGFWLLGVVVLLGAEPAGRRRLWAAALLFTASMFSKHNEVVLAPLPVLWLWWRDGRPAAFRLALAMAACGASALLLCTAAWGWNALYLNLWRVPAGHPWALTGLHGLGEAAQRFFDLANWLFAACAGLAIVDLRLDPRGSLRDRLRARPWILPAAAALVIFPISLVGYIKIGGDDNSFHAVYFLAAAIGMIVGRWTAEDRPAGLRTAMTVLALGVALTGTVLSDRGREPLDEQYRNSRLQREYRFAKEHPEEVWLGANPLVTLYTDRKAYHHGYGVYDRTLPKIPPSAEHLKAYLPARMRWVSTPGEPFWMPEGLTPIAAPAGLEETRWYEKSPAGP